MAEQHSEERNLDTLYREVLFDHYRRPRHRCELPGAEVVNKGHNPLCGDLITVYGKLGADGRLAEVAFIGKACAICTASASMMTDAVRGRALPEAESLCDHVKQMMRNEVPFEVPEAAPDFEALEGVKKFPVRVKCATLPWTTLKDGILAYRAGRLAQGTNTEKEGSCATDA